MRPGDRMRPPAKGAALELEDLVFLGETTVYSKADCDCSRFPSHFCTHTQNVSVWHRLMGKWQLKDATRSTLDPVFLFVHHFSLEPSRFSMSSPARAIPPSLPSAQGLSTGLVKKALKSGLVQLTSNVEFQRLVAKDCEHGFWYSTEPWVLDPVEKGGGCWFKCL